MEFPIRIDSGYRMLGSVASSRNGDDACYTKKGYSGQCHETPIVTHTHLDRAAAAAGGCSAFRSRRYRAGGAPNARLKARLNAASDS